MAYPYYHSYTPYIPHQQHIISTSPQQSSSTFQEHSSYHSHQPQSQDTTPTTPSFPSFPWELFTPYYTHGSSSPSLYPNHGYSPHSNYSSLWNTPPISPQSYIYHTPPLTLYSTPSAIPNPSYLVNKKLCWLSVKKDKQKHKKRKMKKTKMSNITLKTISTFPFPASTPTPSSLPPNPLPKPPDRGFRNTHESFTLFQSPMAPEIKNNSSKPTKLQKAEIKVQIVPVKVDSSSEFKEEAPPQHLKLDNGGSDSGSDSDLSSDGDEQLADDFLQGSDEEGDVNKEKASGSESHSELDSDSDLQIYNDASCFPITPEEEKRIVSELIKKSELKLKQGNLYCDISNIRFSRWKMYAGHYLGMLSTAQPSSYGLNADTVRPGPINNSDILSNVSKNDEHMFLREADKGGAVDVKLILTSLWKTISSKNLTSIEVERISDGYDEGGLSAVESLEIYKETFWRVISKSFSELIQKLSTSKTPPSYVILDVYWPWTLDAGQSFGLLGMVFFNQSCSLNSIYLQTHEKFIELELSKPDSLLPGLSKLAQVDFSTFLCKYGSYPGYFDIVVNQFDNISKVDREDIKREIHILQHLSGQPNIVESEGAYEDRFSLHLVIELCAGGELFDRIIAQGHYFERAAARIFRDIVNVVHNCHFMGVLHLDLKPGNLLLSSKDEGSALKATDFGLSVYIEEGKVYRDMVDSAYYVARHHFNHGVFHDAADFAIPPKPPDSPLLSIYNTVIELAVRGGVNFGILKGAERYDEGRTGNKGKVVESDIEVVAANGTRCPAVGVSMLRLVKYTSMLLPPLEAFCSAKETCVRDKVVESLCQIGSQMRESDMVEYFIPLVKRLAAGEWFTAQVSACVLSHIAHPTAPATTKAGLRSIYTQLCQDDMPMVRRSDATSLGKFAATVEYTHFKADIMSIFNNFALGKLLEPQDCVAHILLVMVNSSQDKLWRVCYMVAIQLFEFYEAVGREPTGSELVPAYVGLLHDNEAEVRIAAAGKVTKFCRILCPIETTLDAVESSYMRKLIFQILEFVLQIISDNLLFKQWDPGTISLLSY